MRTAEVPAELGGRPFTLAEARAAGLTRRQLQSGVWRRLWSCVYVAANVPDSFELRLQAVRLGVPYPLVLCGRTAGWLHGIDTAYGQAVEVVVPGHFGAGTRAGVRFRRTELLPDDEVMVRGFPATSIRRTLFDLANDLPLVEAVTITDTALRLHKTALDDLQRYAQDRRGAKGIRKFRRVIDLADPLAESPMESRLRLILVLNGLPTPESQTQLYGRKGNLIGRADLYYPSRRLVIEYDGDTHRESLAEDNRRQNLVLAAGYRLLRFTKADLRNPALIAQIVSAELQVARAA